MVKDIAISELIVLLYSVDQNLKTAKYSLDDVNTINTVIDALRIHARRINECCN